MFPSLPACRLTDDGIDALVELLRRGSFENGTVPAGFTYLGQFVDHDITFDPTSQLDQANDPHALANFRTPRLDLDSLYGSGPQDQPFLYDWDSDRAGGTKLLVGHNEGCLLADDDLPRNQQGRALTGDARNDENLIVSQLHLLFICFHNAVVDHLCDRGHSKDGDLFEEARRIVRWHYQWIASREFLRKVVGETTASSVLSCAPGGALAARCRHYASQHRPFIPVEFSAAAYRFGHTMVRDDYRINDASTAIALFPTAAGEPDHLAGLRRLPAGLVIDWGAFFRLDDSEFPPQFSLRMDPAIAEPLFALPTGEELPRLNLRRSRALGLPSGQDVACAMDEPVLAPEHLRLQAVLDADVRGALLEATPLWYYILCEAAVKRPGPEGTHLGPVGGRIVAEVLVGLLEGDPSSYLCRDPAWRPHELLPGRDDFTMADLVAFANPPRPPAACPP